MIKINIICIGKIKEKYFTDAIAEYAKRLTAFCKFNIIELSEERIKSNIPNRSQIDEVIFYEGKRIMQKISPSDYVVAMCIEGKSMSSEELSKLIDNASVSGKSTVDFIIGGSYGLDESVKKRADVRLSMSRMTFPHQMARMILSEQIYRVYQHYERKEEYFSYDLKTEKFQKETASFLPSREDSYERLLEKDRQLRAAEAEAGVKAKK